mmetsp:Transcript_25667/g.36209  ORF Transcript_25667/g.36209 Transcript_25667/m.36209 type:complete len:128 (+) Transcript_25667:219-602(+)
MRLSKSAAVLVPGLAVGAMLLSTPVDAFLTPTTLQNNNYHHLVSDRQRHPSMVVQSSTSDDEDCGCGTPLVLSGNPSSKARSLNPREAIRKSTFFTVSGDTTSIDNLIGEPSSTNGVSVVVLLRSFG